MEKSVLINDLNQTFPSYGSTSSLPTPGDIGLSQEDQFSRMDSSPFENKDRDSLDDTVSASPELRSNANLELMIEPDDLPSHLVPLLSIPHNSVCSDCNSPGTFPPSFILPSPSFIPLLSLLSSFFIPLSPCSLFFFLLLPLSYFPPSPFSPFLLPPFTLFTVPFYFPSCAIFPLLPFLSPPFFSVPPHISKMKIANKEPICWQLIVPQWLLCTYGALVCTPCASVHKQLNNTPLKSIHFDIWDMRDIQVNPPFFSLPPFLSSPSLPPFLLFVSH